MNNYGVLFAQLRDWSGEYKCCWIPTPGLGCAADFNAATEADLVGDDRTHGRQRPEPIVDRHGWRLIGKCLRPLPNKWKAGSRSPS